MSEVTSSELVKYISQLDKQKIYKYVSGNSQLRIVEIRGIEGPITI